MRKKAPRLVALLKLRDDALGAELAKAYHEETGGFVPPATIDSVIKVLIGKARDLEPVALHLRAARHEADGSLWFDMGDKTGRAIRIGMDGWSVEATPPMLFRRTATTGALPTPIKGGNLERLWEFVNLAKSDRPLLLAWLIAALIPDIAHPVVILVGGGGVGKTTAAKTLISLIDPGPAPTRGTPHGEKEFRIAANGSWAFCYDNLSDIRPWLSDEICRLVTGDANVSRALYTDDGLAITQYRRCLILTSIGLNALRGDLISRALPINLAPIGTTNRKGDEELRARWQEAHGAILGGLLDLAAKVLQARNDAAIEHDIRMADFARIVAAVDLVMGSTGLLRYIELQDQLKAEMVSGSMFLTVVAEVCRLGGGQFVGTSSQLREACWRRVTHDQKGSLPDSWPRDAHAVGQFLRRETESMRANGWTITDDAARNRQKVVKWTLRPPPNDDDGGLPSVHANPAVAAARELQRARAG